MACDAFVKVQEYLCATLLNLVSFKIKIGLLTAFFLNRLSSQKYKYPLLPQG